MRKNYVASLLILGLIFPMQLSAAPVFSTADSTSYEQQLTIGIDAFYQSDWTKAEQIFKDLKKQRPQDSRAYFFASMIPFWNYYFGGQSPKAADQFLRRSQRAIEVSKNQLNRNASDTTMVLMLSGLYGYRSLVAAGESQYREALQSGMTGFKYTRQLLSIDNDDPKALIGKGMFYYMVGSVPNGLKWVTNMAGMSADMQEGFEILEQAAQSKSYVSNDAKMILSYLYEKEGQNEKSLHHLQELCEQYPQNIIFQYNRARLLEKSDKLESARENYQLVARMDTNALEILQQKSRDRLKKL